MFRFIGLDDYSSGIIPSSRSSCNLAKELEGSFSAPKVRQIQRHVRKQRSHERHSGNIVTLGDHLGPNKYVDIATFPTCRSAIRRASRVYRSCPYPCVQCAPLVMLPEGVFDLFGSCANPSKAFITAVRARFAGWSAEIAVMAAGDIALEM